MPGNSEVCEMQNKGLCSTSVMKCRNGPTLVEGEYLAYEEGVTIPDFEMKSPVMMPTLKMKVPEGAMNRSLEGLGTGMLQR